MIAVFTKRQTFTQHFDPVLFSNDTFARRSINRRQRRQQDPWAYIDRDKNRDTDQKKPRLNFRTQRDNRHTSGLNVEP